MKQRIVMTIATIVVVAGIAIGFQNCALETAPVMIDPAKELTETAQNSSVTSSGKLEQVHFPKIQCNNGPLPLMIFGNVETVYPGSGAGAETSSAKVNALQFCKFQFGKNAELVEFLEQNLFGDEAEGCSWAAETDEFEAEFMDYHVGSRSKKPSFSGLARVTCRVP